MKQTFFFLLCIGATSASLSLAAPTKSASKQAVATLMVPVDAEGEHLALRLEETIADTLNAFDRFQIRRSDELWPVASDLDAENALASVQSRYLQAKRIFDAHRFEEAEAQLRPLIAQYSDAVAAMTSCASLCDAIAMLSASLLARGDVEEAKATLIDLLALDASFQPSRDRFSSAFLNLVGKISSTKRANLRGTVIVRSRPAGARVFLNGELKGYTPLTLPTVAVGKAMLRLERPGFRQWGTLLDVTADDREFTRALEATSQWKTNDALLGRLLKEIHQKKLGTASAALAKSIQSDRAVLARVRENAEGRNELSLLYIDLKGSKILSSQRATFLGDEYGQMKFETSRLVNALVSAGDGEPQPTSTSTDPLDHRAGTEDWNADDRGGKGEAKLQKNPAAGDPLNQVSGTEDW